MMSVLVPHQHANRPPALVSIKARVTPNSFNLPSFSMRRSSTDFHRSSIHSQSDQDSNGRISFRSALTGTGIEKEKPTWGHVSPYQLSPAYNQVYPHSTNYSSSASKSNRSSVVTQASHISRARSPPPRPRSPTPLSFPDNSIQTMVAELEVVSSNPRGRRVAMFYGSSSIRPTEKISETVHKLSWDESKGITEVVTTATGKGWVPPKEWDVRKRPRSAKDLEKGYYMRSLDNFTVLPSMQKTSRRQDLFLNKRSFSYWFFVLLILFITLYLLINNVYLDIHIADLLSPTKSPISNISNATSALTCLFLFPLLPPKNYPCSQCQPFLSNTVSSEFEGLQSNITEAKNFCSLKTIADSSISTSKVLQQQGWLTTRDFCSWKGVICQDGPIIDKLSLRNFGLKDPLIVKAISSSTSLASSLTVLDLSLNNLSGPIPHFDSFQRLKQLNLRNNSFEKAEKAMISEKITVLI